MQGGLEPAGCAGYSAGKWCRLRRAGAPSALTFTGEPGNGPYLAGGLARSAATPSGWWRPGNPYPAPLAWDQPLPVITGLDAALYTLQSAGRYEGPYASFVRGVSVNGGSNLIPPGQAFFVRNSRPGTTATLRFTNAARLSTYPSPAARSAPEARTLLTPEVQGSGGASPAAVYFEAGATRRFDSAFNACQRVCGYASNPASTCRRISSRICSAESQSSLLAEL
ncbi:hypothetical protein GCM10022408_04460 [Hymenobacter fastidiosus]|uniref:Uncharacterized protein n=1 Tax=Hymenobacter fastidiosus TaxID=486264 RepID=A0ABP7RG34_9BACT